MFEQYTSTEIISATRFDGKSVDYIVELTIEPVNESSFKIVKFTTQEFKINNSYPESVHDLRAEHIIYCPNKINKLTHKETIIRPIRVDKIDVYPIIYDSKPGWVQEANIPCKLIHSAIAKVPNQEIKAETRGRHKKYSSDNERRLAQQRHALLHHYRKEALENYLKSNPNEEIITVRVNVSSRVLGNLHEEITYKKLPDGTYRKVQTQ